MGFSVDQLPPWQLTSLRMWKPKPQSFYNLISEAISHHFCLILFVRSDISRLTCTQGEGITPGHDYREAGLTGAVLAGAYYHQQWNQSLQYEASLMRVERYSSYPVLLVFFFLFFVVATHSPLVIPFRHLLILPGI